jgi:multicomponent Na+:H+ antiporter subunit D
LFSALMVGLGIVGLVRVAVQMFPTAHGLLVLLTVLGIGSALVGALLALVQDDLKRLLAWDTVSQMGLIIAGFASRTVSGVAGAMYHLVNHGLFKALLFLCAGAIVHSTGITHLSEMGGLARKRPLLTAGFTIGCAAIAGVPGLNGYASIGLIHDGLRDEPAAYIGALIAQVVTVAALSRAAYLAFYRRRSEPYERLERSRLGMRISLIVLGAGCIAFGIGAAPFIREIAAPATSVLLHPARYVAGVLHGSGSLPPVDVAFEYLSAETLLSATAEILIGVLLAVLVIRRGAPRVLDGLRRVHTGSVNDYAAFAAVGLAVSAFVLLA